MAPPDPLGPEGFRDRTDVSRETLDRLRLYLDLLIKWQRSINLVGRSTLADPWRRHMLDSWQLLEHVPPKARIVADLGSGAGFPGLVLAILGVKGVHLIDSDGRKCAFLREVARQTDTAATVITARLEDYPRGFPDGLQADLVTARALAPVDRLLWLSRPILTKSGVCLFLKGRNVDQELTESAKNWKIAVSRYPSLSDRESSLLKIQGVESIHEPPS